MKQNKMNRLLNLIILFGLERQSLPQQKWKTNKIDFAESDESREAK